MKADNPQLKKLPDDPGVYFFLGKGGEVLYIGKATSLRSRVKSYFNSDILKSRGPLIMKMVNEAMFVDYRTTDSVLEALVLEASLIKSHYPRYNAREKDDKSYNYIVITREMYPRVLIVRGRELDRKFTPDNIKYIFGPFPQGGLLKDALQIIRKIFPFRDICKVPNGEKKRKNKLCFSGQIGLCPGVCAGGISKREYGRTINNIKLFFEGKKALLIKKLEQEMLFLAEKKEFEKAGVIKQQIFALKHINDVTLLKREVKELSRGGGEFRIEAYDIAHTGGKNMVGAMVVLLNEEIEKSGYRKFLIKSVQNPNDTAALKEMLVRRFDHNEWKLPNLIVVDGGRAQINVARKALDSFGYKIPIVSVVKDEHHRPREILGALQFKEKERAILLANSEAHRFSISFHRKKRDSL